MHWDEASFKRVIKRDYKIEIYGMPEGVKLKSPWKISKLEILGRLIRSWRSGQTGFRRMEEAEVAAMEAEVNAEAEKRNGKGLRNEDVKRREMRRVMTIGLKAKAKVKSPEFILDSDMEDN